MSHKRDRNQWRRKQTYLCLQHQPQPSPMVLEVIPMTSCQVYMSPTAAAMSAPLLLFFAGVRSVRLGMTEVRRPSRPQVCGGRSTRKKGHQQSPDRLDKEQMQYLIEESPGLVAFQWMDGRGVGRSCLQFGYQPSGLDLGCTVPPVCSDV